MSWMTFESEVFFEDRNYPFIAAFNSRQWTARIFDEAGALHGVIQCVAPGPSLAGDRLEDEVCDWVHRSVVGRAGFFDTPVADISLAPAAALAAEVVEFSNPSLEETIARSAALRAELAARMVTLIDVKSRLVEVIDRSRDIRRKAR